MFGAAEKILSLGFLDDRKMYFLALFHGHISVAKAPHFLYYTPQNIHSPASLKKPTTLPVQLPVQISVTSNETALNSRF